MYLVKCMQIDINGGYNKVVNPELTKVLVDLQKGGAKILGVDQQGVDGRKAYVIVKYDDPKFDEPSVEGPTSGEF